MSGKYAEIKCDICQQLVKHGNPLMTVRCHHKFHRQCLLAYGEMDDTKCPLCENKHTVVSSATSRVPHTRSPVLLKTETASTSTSKESKKADDILSTWSCLYCKHNNSLNSTKCDACGTIPSSDANKIYQDIVASMSDNDPSTSSFHKTATVLATTSDIDRMQSSSPVIGKIPTLKKLPRQHSELSLQWECQSCGYENERTTHRCANCSQGRQHHTLTRSMSYPNSPEPMDTDSPNPVVPKGPSLEQMSNHHALAPTPKHIPRSIVQKTAVLGPIFDGQDEPFPSLHRMETRTDENERSANHFPVYRADYKLSGPAESISNDPSSPSTGKDTMISHIQRTPVSETMLNQHFQPSRLAQQRETRTDENERSTNQSSVYRADHKPYGPAESISNDPSSPSIGKNTMISHIQRTPVSETMLNQHFQPSPVVPQWKTRTDGNKRSTNQSSVYRADEQDYEPAEPISNDRSSQPAGNDTLVSLIQETHIPDEMFNQYIQPSPPVQQLETSKDENYHPPQPTQSRSPKISPSLYSALSHEDTRVSTSAYEKEPVIFVPDLILDKSDTELERMIQTRLIDDHHVHVTKVRCFTKINVATIQVASERDKNQLVKSLQSIVLDPQTHMIIHFVEHLELFNYLVLDSNTKSSVTLDQIADQWQHYSKSSHSPLVEPVAVQFPNAFKIVSRSLDEILAMQNRDVIRIDQNTMRIYLNADCSFFEDLPSNTTASQIQVAINAQIGGQFDQNSLYVQCDREASNAMVLATKGARQWTNISRISLNNKFCTKKNRLALRLVLHPLPREIPTEAIVQDQQLRTKVVQSTRSGDTLIVEVNDKSVYDQWIDKGAILLRDHSVNVEPFTKLISDSENMEINAETWYETQMLEYPADLKQFIDNPEHPIFKYNWNHQKWLEQLNRHEGKQGDEHDRQRRLLRVTVMVNTIAVLWKQRYTLEIRNKKVEVKLNLERMKNIVYNHRSKLEGKKEISGRLSTPFQSTTVRVLNEDCLVAYQRLASENKHPVLLNMANAKTPGGGYRRGAGAQEENVFRRSNYYLSLDMELDYNEQADRFVCTSDGDLKPLGTHQKFYPIDEYGAIYTSGITVFRDIEHKGYPYLEQPVYGVCSIASAAYCRPDLKRNDPSMLKNKVAVDTRKKIENFFAIAHRHGHDCLVLSAFGCGAFRNPPSHIAMIYKSVIEQYAGYFQEIYFSIIDDHNAKQQHNLDGNFRPFKDVLHHMVIHPSKNELDVNMASGPYRVLSKNQGRLMIDHVKILDLPPCMFGSLCHELTDTQHCQSYSHPPLCPQYDSCNPTTQDCVHLSSFIHRTNCSQGGLCKSIDDEKHLRLFIHPEYCSDRGLCKNMETNHLIRFRHLPLCKERLKCVQLKYNDADHCRSYRHCLPTCSYGNYCVKFHDREHCDDQAHPFRPPCPLTPFVCRDHIEYCRAKDSPQGMRRSVEDHCMQYSHVCPFGRQCRDKSDSHTRISIHIARNICSKSKDCKQLSNEEHLNAYTHQQVDDIRFVCKHSNADCPDRWTRDHLLRYRHIGYPDHLGVVRYFGLNRSINFVRNQNEFIRRIHQYMELQKWKPPKDHLDEVIEWIRALQPVHRCNSSIFESILVHRHVMSRKYMEGLRDSRFVENVVNQQPEVRRILDQPNNADLQRYAKEYIRELVAIEFDKNAPVGSYSGGLAGGGGDLYQTPVRNERMEIVQMREAQMKQFLSPDKISAIRENATRLAQTSLELHKNPMGIGHASDDSFGTNDHVLSILGPNLGPHYGDIFIIFKHELMFHSDSSFSIQAATTYGQNGNVYKNRPWLKDPVTMADRVQCFHQNKLHSSITGYDYAAALELMVITVLKRKTVDVKLKDIIEHWMHVDSQEMIEAHLPQLIPLDYIEHIYMPKSLFHSLSDYARHSAREMFGANLTITDHSVDFARQSYERLVHDEVRKKIENNKTARCHRGTILTLPAMGNGLAELICIPMSISQSFDQYQSNQDQNDSVFIYWQALGGDMMLAISEHQIDRSQRQWNNPCLLCYIADISTSDNINDYRESYSYITNNQPDSHDTLVQNGNVKAKSSAFHRGCNIYDYITYCLRINRKTGEISLIHAGANSIYNHQTINYTFQRAELDVTKLDYIHLIAYRRSVPIRNLVIRHESIEEYHPSFDKKFPEGRSSSSPQRKSPGVAAAAHQNDAEQDDKSVWSYLKDFKEKVFGKDDPPLLPCRDSIYCLVQYSSQHSESHNKKYSHPCRFSELCRTKSEHKHLEHYLHPASMCRHDQNCRERTNPVHRALYRHTDLPDFLVPCRYQLQCRDRNRPDHSIKYFHGEKIPMPSPKAAQSSPKGAYNDYYNG